MKILTQDSKEIACIVLASGFSRRFGDQDKLSAKLPNGQTVIEQTLAIYQAVFDRVHLITRPEQFSQSNLSDSTEWAECGNFDNHVELISNHNAEQGMSQSMVTAVSKVPSEGGWLFALGDMPYLEESTVRMVLEQSLSSNIVQPCYKGRPGHPVFFGGAFAQKLLNLQGDQGARGLVDQANSQQLVKLPVDDPSILWDIDLLADICG